MSRTRTFADHYSVGYAILYFILLSTHTFKSFATDVIRQRLITLDDRYMLDLAHILTFILQ